MLMSLFVVSVFLWLVFVEPRWDRWRLDEDETKQGKRLVLARLGKTKERLCAGRGAIMKICTLCGEKISGGQLVSQMAFAAPDEMQKEEGALIVGEVVVHTFCVFVQYERMKMAINGVLLSQADFGRGLEFDKDVVASFAIPIPSAAARELDESADDVE